MIFKNAAVLACVGLAQAMPAQTDVADLESRAGVVKVDQKFRDALPGCDFDPSYGGKSGYMQGNGVKVPKDGKDDACTTGHNSDHCWTEYWIVEAEVEFSEWTNSGSSIDCKTTSTCSSADIDLGQTCDTHGNASSSGGEWKIIDAAIEGKVWDDKVGLKLGMGGSYKVDNQDNKAHMTCTSESARNQCTWNDQGCHQIWYAQRDARLYGYAVRVCNGKTNGKTQMNEQRGDGKWVRGMQDFNFKLPINKAVGCGADCRDVNYKEPKKSEPGRFQFHAEGW
ncbi:hypothetical protein GGR52DRAFT_217909 [Hypoxylon sp. FL1284]|nr:hypothetical protein GGR52DRAFT_217909 [Hypoxylon sp. FL1284]